MAPSIGLNLRVTGYCNQGGRKYMEDVFSVAYQQTEDEKDLEYAFFGIFDGHGGREAAIFAKEHLMDFIVRQKSFWANDDESVTRAIHEGFIQTHQAMWKELENWPKTASGLPSTAGTTASIAFIRRSKIYIGHVGDSAIVLGVQDPTDPDTWRCEPLTRDHKPESVEESIRIQQSGGKVICKSGVPRVVWNRPKMGHKGPVRRSTHIDEIPFLAVARSLGDLWSYNSEEDVFVVSPEPDTYVYPIDIQKHRCLILGTDGAWNMLSPQQAVTHVCQAEKANEQHMLNPTAGRQWINPSKRLVDKAIEKWNMHNLRADNTSVVTVMLDPPGPPRAQVLKRQRELAMLNNTDAAHGLVDPNRVNSERGSVALVTNTTPLEDSRGGPSPTLPAPPPSSPLPSSSSSSSSMTTPESGPPPPPPSITQNQQQKQPAISIISRFPNSRNRSEAQGHNLAASTAAAAAAAAAEAASTTTTNGSTREGSGKVVRDFQIKGQQNKRSSSRLTESTSVLKTYNSAGAIQCNEISSSDDDTTPMKKSKNEQHHHHHHQQQQQQQNYRQKVLTPRLSRELSALQIDSPGYSKTSNRKRKSSLSPPSYKGRTRSESSSDTENEAQEINRAPQRRQLRSSTCLKASEHVTTPTNGSKRGKKKDVELECIKLNERIKNMERKVARKTEQLNNEVKMLQSTIIHQGTHFLRSASSSTTTSVTPPPPPPPPRRSARTNNSPVTPLSSRKRKREAAEELSKCTPSKSPRKSNRGNNNEALAVQQKQQPVITTRSRRARVLQLKK